MTMTENSEQVRPMMTAEQILAQIPFSRSSLFRLEAQGLFPKGHSIMKNHKLWFASEIVTWQKDFADPHSELSRKLIELGIRQPGPGGKLNE